jgi:hypothetical protein
VIIPPIIGAAIRLITPELRAVPMRTRNVAIAEFATIGTTRTGGIKLPRQIKAASVIFLGRLNLEFGQEIGFSDGMNCLKFSRSNGHCRKLRFIASCSWRRSCNAGRSLFAIAAPSVG